eukprot:5115173-Amphidinium_carterae.2
MRAPQFVLIPVADDLDLMQNVFESVSSPMHAHAPLVDNVEEMLGTDKPPVSTVIVDLKYST